MKSAKKVTPRRKVARRGTRAPALSLSMRIERLEKAVLFKAPQPEAPISTPRFTNLGADGKPTAGDHVAVHDAQNGLMWAASPIQGGKDLNHADASRAAAELDLLGRKGWRLPTIQELLSLVDYERWGPAVDPKHFKGPYGWTWSSTLVKGEGAPAGYARVVVLDDGSSGWSHRGSHGQALAVRASQQLGLLG
ncbi:MAG: DUF1566 domain-containing protein [Patescibacteria group bacterium]|nr:DUF1566 domain-containing protein [Patescibacteria group bacterium]